MHTSEPPVATMEDWLKSYPSVEGNYGHLLLEQKTPLPPGLVDGLRLYFESAHLDAREHFHAQIAIDLYPDSDAPGTRACYTRSEEHTTDLQSRMHSSYAVY